MTPPRALLDIDGVTKRFGAVTAVDGVSLEVRENEFFALLGPSGCGKTTLLRMLAGFETPSAGRILLDGSDIAPMPPNRRPVNMMFQSYALFPHMSVRANIAYGLEMERLPKAEISARVDAILATTELSALAARKPEELSGGQRQRVALARALVKRPRLLLLDEPLGALDKKLRGQMQLELKRLQHEVGITFVVVTHDQDEALVMADRMAVLKDGKLQQCDTPAAIYERPDNAFVAGFIGEMNFFPGTFAGDAVSIAGGRVAGRPVGTLANGAAARAAVRPERIRLAADASANLLSGTVEAIAYHGLDLQLHIACDGSLRPVMVRQTSDQAARQRVTVGDPVTLAFDPADTLIYPD